MDWEGQLITTGINLGHHVGFRSANVGLVVGWESRGRRLTTTTLTLVVSITTSGLTMTKKSDILMKLRRICEVNQGRPDSTLKVVVSGCRGPVSRQGSAGDTLTVPFYSRRPSFVYD